MDIDAMDIDAMDIDANFKKKKIIFIEFLKYFTLREKYNNPIYFYEGRTAWYRKRVKSIYNNEKEYLCLNDWDMDYPYLYFDSPNGYIPYREHYNRYHSHT